MAPSHLNLEEFGPGSAIHPQDLLEAAENLWIWRWSASFEAQLGFWFRHPGLESAAGGVTTRTE